MKSAEGNRYIIVAKICSQDLYLQKQFPKTTQILCKPSLQTSYFLQHQCQNVSFQTTELPTTTLDFKSLHETRHRSTIRSSLPPTKQRFSRTIHVYPSKYDCCFTTDHQQDWDTHIQHVIFAYNTTPHEETKESPYFLVFGRYSRLPTDIISIDNIDHHLTSDIRPYRAHLLENLTTAYQHVQKANTTAKTRNADKLIERTQKKEWVIGDLVWLYHPPTSNSIKGLSAKLVKPWRGPYRILERDGSRFTLQSLDSQSLLKNIHADRLKTYWNRNGDVSNLKGKMSREVTFND